MSAAHYTENNDSALNKNLRADLIAMFGPNAIPDIATVATYDGMQVIYRIVDKFGPVEERAGKPANVAFDRIKALWKEHDPVK